MTTEEMHEYNKRQAIHDLSYWSVCTTDFTIELRKFMTKWLDKLTRQVTKQQRTENYDTKRD